MRCRPSCSAACFTACEPGTTMARTFGCTRCPLATRAAARRSSRRELVHDPMNTRSTAIFSIRRPGPQAHVRERLFGGAPVGFLLKAAYLGNARVHRHHHSRIRTPRDERSERGRVDFEHALVFRSGIGRERPPAGDSFFPVLTFGRKAAAFEVGKCRLVGRDHARPRSRLDAHIAERHPALPWRARVPLPPCTR